MMMLHARCPITALTLLPLALMTNLVTNPGQALTERSLGQARFCGFENESRTGTISGLDAAMVQ